jgi:hypothetical protein
MNRTRRAFDYKPPTYEEAQALSQRRGGMFDGLIKQGGPKFFKPKAGDNFVRILPPTWEDARHYALEVKIHRNIGVDNQSYLCLMENESSQEKNCPICQERQELARNRAKQEEMDALRANPTLLVYLIDRSDEKSGPMLWGMSNRSNTEILSQSLEKRQQIYLPVAHPIDGFDIEFTREGEGLLTRYRGFKVARQSSPITDDPERFEEWLNYIEDHPIPDQLQFFPAERIKLVFYGKADTTEETPPTRLREERSVPPDRMREAARPANGHDDPPFDTTPKTPTYQEVIPPPPRRAPLEERPVPREAEPAPERRRATLQPESGSATPDEVKDRLRSKLAQRGQ